jgi:hypothetical protein
MDLIAPGYSPVFAHQRTEINRDRIQKIKAINRKEVCMGSHTVESKGGVSGMSAIIDDSNNGSSENVFNHRSVSLNSNSHQGN